MKLIKLTNTEDAKLDATNYIYLNVDHLLYMEEEEDGDTFIKTICEYSDLHVEETIQKIIEMIADD